MRPLSPDVRMQTLQYNAIFVSLKTLKLQMKLSLQKTQMPFVPNIT